MKAASCYYRHADREMWKVFLSTVVLGWLQDIRDPRVFQHCSIFLNRVTKSRLGRVQSMVSPSGLDVLPKLSAQSTPGSRSDSQKVLQGVLRRKQKGEKHVI